MTGAANGVGGGGGGSGCTKVAVKVGADGDVGLVVEVGGAGTDGVAGGVIDVGRGGDATGGVDSDAGVAGGAGVVADEVSAVASEGLACSELQAPFSVSRTESSRNRITCILSLILPMLGNILSPQPSVFNYKRNVHYKQGGNNLKYHYNSDYYMLPEKTTIFLPAYRVFGQIF